MGVSLVAATPSIPQKSRRKVTKCPVETTQRIPRQFYTGSPGFDFRLTIGLS
jgi:hypothetical protein